MIDMQGMQKKKVKGEEDREAERGEEEVLCKACCLPCISLVLFKHQVPSLLPLTTQGDGTPLPAQLLFAKK